MHPVRILATATAIEVCLLTGLLALAGLAGAAVPWFDLVNSVAPALIPLGLGGAILVRALLPAGAFRRFCMISGSGAAVYAAVMISPDVWGRLSAQDHTTGAIYRVVSANTFRDNMHPLRAAEALTSRGADAVLLQESDNVTYTLRSMIVLDRVYPYTSTCPGFSVQIRLKTPILAQGCGVGIEPGDPVSWMRDFVWVRTLGPNGRPIVLATTHLRRPYPPERQALERDQVARALSRMPVGDPVILAGDFNTVPWSFGMRAQDKALRPLRRMTHLEPTYPAWLQFARKPWGWPVLPIDHVYASSGWSSARVARFRVPDSDHFALETVLKLAPGH